MKLWTIWIQADDHTWLEAAWDDESTAEDASSYEESVRAAQSVARTNKGLCRVIAIEVPDADIFDAFEAPVVRGSVASGEGE